MQNNFVSITAIGQDSHRFVANDLSDKPLVLGGVVIPNCAGLDGNSDADVILHAITNAVSGLSGVNILGKISDDLCLNQGITDSRIYLEKALETIAAKNIVLTHVSISIEAKRPHLSSHIIAIKKSIAEMLSLTIDNVGLTATTGEGLTSFGRGAGIFVTAILSAVRAV